MVRRDRSSRGDFDAVSVSGSMRLEKLQLLHRCVASGSWPGYRSALTVGAPRTISKRNS